MIISLLIAHFISSLGTALYLNAAIGFSAQNDHISTLAAIQALILLPSVALGRWLGGLSSKVSLIRIMLISDGLGVLLMSGVALGLQNSGALLVPQVLLGAASGSLIDFFQATAKNIQLTLGHSQAKQARIIGAFHAVQAFNLVFAPLIVGQRISSIPVEIWAWVNAASYLLSIGLLGSALLATSFAFQGRKNTKRAELPTEPHRKLQPDFSSKLPLSFSEISLLMILSIFFGSCGVLIPLAGVGNGRGASGALLAESFYAAGICFSGLFAGRLSMAINTRFISFSLVALLGFSLLLAKPHTSSIEAYSLSFCCGLLLPLLEIYLVLAIRKAEPEEASVGHWLGRLSSLVRLAMLAGVLIYPAIRALVQGLRT